MEHTTAVNDIAPASQWPCRNPATRTFGDETICQLGSLSLALTHASDDDLMSVGYALANAIPDLTTALLAVCDIEGYETLQREVQLALELAELRTSTRCFREDEGL